jgi:hypothetical protein
MLTYELSSPESLINAQRQKLYLHIIEFKLHHSNEGVARLAFPIIFPGCIVSNSLKQLKMGAPPPVMVTVRLSLL